jgi:hypothetical protein
MTAKSTLNFHKLNVFMSVIILMSMCVQPISELLDVASDFTVYEWSETSDNSEAEKGEIEECKLKSENETEYENFGNAQLRVSSNAIKAYNLSHHNSIAIEIISPPPEAS